MDPLKVMALHQKILDLLSRKDIAIADRYWLETFAVKRALKLIQQLNSLGNAGSMGSKPYQEKFQSLMEHLRALGLYPLIAEDLHQTFGVEGMDDV